MRLAWVVALVAVLGGVARADNALVVLVDRTMSPDKIATITHGLTEGLENFAATDDIALVSYDTSAQILVPLQSAHHRARISAAAANIRTAARADLSAGLRTANDLLSRSSRSHKYILVVSDGTDFGRYDAMLPKLRRNHIVVSTLGYQVDTATALRDLASAGNGYAYALHRGKDLPRAFSASLSGRPARTLAVVFAIDRSGYRNNTTLDLVKEVVRTQSEYLPPDAIVSVVTCDVASQIYLRPQRAANHMRFSTEISRIAPGRNSSYLSGLEAAFDVLKDVDATDKQVIVIGDGYTGVDGIAQILADMRAADITVSAVGVANADRDLMSMIADGGDGRLYLVDDPSSIPKMFAIE